LNWLCEFHQLPVPLGVTGPPIGLIYRTYGLPSPTTEALIKHIRTVIEG
jgi:hypothetical protein